MRFRARYYLSFQCGTAQSRDQNHVCSLMLGVSDSAAFAAAFAVSDGDACAVNAAADACAVNAAAAAFVVRAAADACAVKAAAAAFVVRAAANACAVNAAAAAFAVNAAAAAFAVNAAAAVDVNAATGACAVNAAAAFAVNAVAAAACTANAAAAFAVKAAAAAAVALAVHAAATAFAAIVGGCSAAAFCSSDCSYRLSLLLLPFLLSLLVMVLPSRHPPSATFFLIFSHVLNPTERFSEMSSVVMHFSYNCGLPTSNFLSLQNLQLYAMTR